MQKKGKEAVKNKVPLLTEKVEEDIIKLVIKDDGVVICIQVQQFTTFHYTNYLLAIFDKK